MSYLLTYLAGVATTIIVLAVAEWLWPIEVPEDSYYDYCKEQESKK